MFKKMNAISEFKNRDGFLTEDENGLQIVYKYDTYEKTNFSHEGIDMFDYYIAVFLKYDDIILAEEEMRLQSINIDDQYEVMNEFEREYNNVKDGMFGKLIERDSRNKQNNIITKIFRGW